MTTAHRGAVVLLLLAIGLSACGGGGGGGGSSSTLPADVSGTWDNLVSTNDDSATFQACTGDASVIDGLTVDEAFADCFVAPITVYRRAVGQHLQL